MMLRKKLCALLLLTALLLLLCSCHGTLNENTENTATDYSSALTDYELPNGLDPDKNYEITFWAKSDSNATQTNLYKSAIKEFEKLYPNISVTLVVEMDYGRIYQNVITNIPTNTTPNVCITYPDHVATYLTGNEIVVPLDKLISDEKFGLGGSELRFDGPDEDEMIEKFMEECYINGHYYALPYMRSTEACYINKTYVESLGFELPEVMTWDFIWEVSEAALEKDENGLYRANGQNILIPFIYKSADNMMIQMLAQKGAEYSNSDGDILIFNDTTTDLLIEIGSHAQSGAFSLFNIVSYPGDFFNKGQCLFAIDSTAGATWMGPDAPQQDIKPEAAVDFEVAVLPIPQYNVDEPVMISQGPSVCIFNKEDPGEVLASWLFTQFLLTNEVQIPYAQTEGYVPVTSKAQNSNEYNGYLSRGGEDNDLYYDVKIKATKLLIENMENTFITPVFNGSMSLRNAAGQMIVKSCKDAALSNKTITSSYAYTLYPEMTALYHLNLGTAGELGKMPTTSIVLISVIATVDLGLIAFFVIQKVKKKKRN